MPGRIYNADDYNYGFQGQEKDDEVKGSGNSVNYKFRVHDPRLGRFLSIDPLSPDYPHNSPYAFSENDVIGAIELEGLEKFKLSDHYDRGAYYKTVTLIDVRAAYEIIQKHKTNYKSPKYNFSITLMRGEDTIDFNLHMKRSWLNYRIKHSDSNTIFDTNIIR